MEEGAQFQCYRNPSWVAQEHTPVCSSSGSCWVRVPAAVQWNWQRYSISSPRYRLDSKSTGDCNGGNRTVRYGLNEGFRASAIGGLDPEAESGHAQSFENFTGAPSVHSR